jgi:hypothetical protein
MTAPGHRLFADALASFAVEVAEPRLLAIAQRIVAPLRVAVHGRRGVGSSTVTHALTAAGLAVTAPAVTPEAVVQVIAEVVKPEDRVAVAAAGHPVLVVLNKADLAGRRCRELGELIGAPTAPMVALLAVAALDDALWVALRLLTVRPADLRSPDAFLADAHPVSTATRRRLLETLDLYGIALVVAALQRGASEAAIGALLRRASGVDALLDQLDTLSRDTRYRRVLDAAAELEILAVTDDRISDFLRSDETVIGRMAAAVDVVEATGLKVDPRDDAAAHLRRAMHWQRYGRGPASALLRSCGADIARGSLRLMIRAGDDAERSDEEERR